jgi:TRAP-type C4-dicarboxylate transport system permease small subunit
MKRVVYRARRLARIIGVAETVLGTLLMLLIFGLMLMQVGQRYLPIGPGVWVGEVARFGLVWLTFALAGYLVSSNEHVAIGVVDTWLKGDTWRRMVKVFVNSVIVVVGIMFARDASAMVAGASGQTTPATGIPLSLIFVIPLLGFILTTMHGLVRLVSAPTLPLAELDEEEASVIPA